MLTPDSKKKLSETIRGLRAKLIKELRDEAVARYRLSVPANVAKLSEATRIRRARLDQWLDERARASGATPDKHERWSDNDDLLQIKSAWRKARFRFLEDAASLAAATFLNRLVVLRCMEAVGIVELPVLTGGLNSAAVKELRDHSPALFADENAGYAWVLSQVFEELALDLPGLFGDVALVGLFEPSAGTLRSTIDELDSKELADAWDDDTTLGWTYQYWNDPKREELDAKINDGGKIEGHEIAAKTQMFTERYMVEWLLQNSLGLQWLAMCRKNGWTADVEKPAETGAMDGERPVTETVLERLEARRVDWRAKRERGEVTLDALMPFTVGELEERWRYYVPQEVCEGIVQTLPASLRDLRVLDPACGSGHFLVIAFGLLAHLYEEEARHRGADWTKPQIAQWILEDNLHGIDLDPRAVQIAAAALHIAARQYAGGSIALSRLNLVATSFDLARLGNDDNAVIALRDSLAKEANISEESTAKIIKLLAGIDTFGSLVKLDKALDEAVADAVKERLAQVQVELFGERPQKPAPREETPRVLVERIERFLAAHTQADDLGVRLDGAQLAGGVRFARMVREGQYHLVVGNPPYQGTTRMTDAAYVAKHYPMGKADLYAAFLQRGLELACVGGLSAMVTMRGWMFLGQFEELRSWMLTKNDLRAIGDWDRGAFDDVPNEVLAVVATVVASCPPSVLPGVATQPTPNADRSYDRERTNRKRAAVLAQVGRYEFNGSAFDVIDGRPIVYWWSTEFLGKYATTPKLGDAMDCRLGLRTSNNARFLRNHWELGALRGSVRTPPSPSVPSDIWAPYIAGADGLQWFEPLRACVRWSSGAIEIRVTLDCAYGHIPQSEAFYFRGGVAFSMIGNRFLARIHRYSSVIGDMGASAFPEVPQTLLMTMNRATSRWVLESLSPGLHFQVGDVARLPLFPVECADEIFAKIEKAFSEHEAARENSVEFRKPGPSPWAYAQAWAQRSVDRAKGEPLPPYEPEYEPPSAKDHVSFALGVALGRFGASGEGVLDTAPPTALPAGILFLSGARERDGLDTAACDGLRTAWSAHGTAIADATDLRTWLRRDFFDHHKARYENRPIWWPLSSAKKTFVAWVAIHRWNDSTLKVLLADHLLPELRALDGELEDLKRARNEGEKTSRANAERRYAVVLKQREELDEFSTAVSQCAERGAPPSDEKCPGRKRDAPYVMDLDDGVMVNASALWPLLDAQWKDTRKWWKELSTADGRKDYDWSHLAARYWPLRVMEKCERDPSLAVAHGCFWRLHPAKAFAWELRLGAENRPDFTIDERDSDACRERFFAEQSDVAIEVIAKELTRRNRKRRATSDDEDDDAPAKEAPRTLRIAKGTLWTHAPAMMLSTELRWRMGLGDEFVIEEPAHEESYRAWVERDASAALVEVATIASVQLELRDPKWAKRGHPRDGLVPRVKLAREGLWSRAPRETYAFELKMREEVDTSFVLEEPGSDEARERYEAEHTEEARELREQHASTLARDDVKKRLPRKVEEQGTLVLGAETVLKAQKKPRAKKGDAKANKAVTE